MPTAAHASAAPAAPGPRSPPVGERKLTQRCQEVGCPLKLTAWHDVRHDRDIVQHGPNPEHVIILTLNNADWPGTVTSWLTRIHPAPHVGTQDAPNA